MSGLSGKLSFWIILIKPVGGFLITLSLSTKENAIKQKQTRLNLFIIRWASWYWPVRPGKYYSSGEREKSQELVISYFGKKNIEEIPKYILIYFQGVCIFILKNQKSIKHLKRYFRSSKHISQEPPHVCNFIFRKKYFRHFKVESSPQCQAGSRAKKPTWKLSNGPYHNPWGKTCLGAI